MQQISPRKIYIDTWTILKVVGILIMLWFLYLISDILVLVFAAIFLAALMHPAARSLSEWHIPKSVTVLMIYLLLFGITALAFVMLVPTLLDQASALLANFGLSWSTLTEFANSIKKFSLNYGLTDNIKEVISGGQFTKAAGELFSTLTIIFGGIVGMIVVLVMAFYAVVEEDKARNVFFNLVPEEYQEITATILKRVEEKIGRWLLGQISLGFIIGLMYYIGLSAVGVKSALVLAVFGGFLEFIPYLGPILGAVPVMIVATSQSPITGLFALIVLIIIQQLENHVIVPKVMQKAVGLNPLVSIVAMLVGAKLFGIVGMLMAIPVSTAVAVVITELFRYSKARNQ